MSRNSLPFVVLVILLMPLVACDRVDVILGRATPGITPAYGTPPPTAALPPGSPTPIVPSATPIVPTMTPIAPSPTPIAPTMTPIAPSATPIVPTMTPVALPSPTPDYGPPPGGTARINFAPGATSASVSSRLMAAGDTDNWVFGARAGQVVTVQTLSSAPGAIVVSLMDMNGGVLDSNIDTTAISAVIPFNGDYFLSFSSPLAAPEIVYTTQVFIPAESLPVEQTRIQFEQGATVAQLNDSLAANGDLNQYVLQVAAGQTITVGVFASPPAVSNIYIRDTAGRLIASGTDMSGAHATAAANGDYFIDISSPVLAPAVSYLLTVNVPPPATTAPQRIAFAAGETSATVNGLIRAASPAHYVLGAQAAQSLIINLAGHPVSTVNMELVSPGGEVLNSARDSFTGLGTLLPATGDYSIFLTTTSQSDVTYVMEVIIPPLPSTGATRIQFDPGASAATVSGSLAFGGDLDNWILTASAGQILNIGVSANPGGWMNLFVYDAAGQFIGYGDDSFGLGVPLDQGGDYTIVVSSFEAAPPVNYSLFVSLPPPGQPPPQQPVRIEFGPGQTSSFPEGTVVAGGVPAQYVLYLLAGQTLTTHLLDNPPGNVEIAIVDPTAVLVDTGRAPSNLDTPTTVTGDYTITISTLSANPVDFSLDIIVEP